MSIIAAKYFEDFGWCGVKNHDVSYKPDIRIRKSFRGNTERLYVWDDKTKYAEGINGAGVGILSSDIDKLIHPRIQSANTRISKRTFYSPDGLRLRLALYEMNATAAIKVLFTQQIPGTCMAFDKDHCFMIEGKFEGEKYYSEITVGHKDSKPTIVKVNKEDNEESYNRRLDVVTKELKLVKDPIEMLEALASQDDTDPQMNPLRVDNTRQAIRTAAQILVVPAERTLHYRPIWCEVRFDLDKLNNPSQKTWFEIVSTRKLISFKEIDV